MIIDLGKLADQGDDSTPQKCFLPRIFSTYDKAFLVSLGLQYFNNGVKVMTGLAFLDMFKNKYDMSPAET